MQSRAEFPKYLTIVLLCVACTKDNANPESAAGGSAIAAGSARGGSSGDTGVSAANGGDFGRGGTSAAAGNSGGAAGGSSKAGAGNGGSGNGGSSNGGTGNGGADDGGAGSAGGSTSCQSGGPGLDDCGPGDESCCTSINVPGGTFYRTYQDDGSGPKDTADPATISDFRLDKYLVTVGRFRKFVTAWDQGSGYMPDVGSGKHTHLNGGKGLADSGAPGSYESGWIASYSNKLDLTNDSLQCQSEVSTWTSTPGAHENLPMNCINWFEAYAFCIWDGGFLASEAEYVYAVAGGSEQRKYPWGSQDPGTNNQYAIWGCYYPDGSGTCDGTLRNLAPLGTAKLGAGRWGHLDLVGELIEWYLDWFASSYANPCTDCANLADGSGRAPRDGYYGSTDQRLVQASYRNNGFYPANRFSSYGFRCARTPR